MGNNSSNQLKRSAEVYNDDADWVQTVKRAKETRIRFASSGECRNYRQRDEIADVDDDGDDDSDDVDGDADNDGYHSHESLTSTNMDEETDEDQMTDGLVYQIANLNCTEPQKQWPFQPNAPFGIVANECEVLIILSPSSIHPELLTPKLDQIIMIKLCSSDTSRIAQLKCCYLHCHPMTTISMVKQFVAFRALHMTDFHEWIDLKLMGCNGFKLYNHLSLQFVQNNIWFKNGRALEVILEEDEEMAIENEQDHQVLKTIANKANCSNQYMTLYYSMRNID